MSEEELEEPPGTNGEEEGDDEGQDPPPPPRVRGRRQQLTKATKESLVDDWNFFQQHDPGDSVEVVFRGDRIGSNSGAADVIGVALQRLARFLASLGGDPYVEGLAFGNSVTITVRPSGTEIRRARKELELAESVVGATDAPPEEITRSLQRALPDVQVALALAAEILDASPSAAPAKAARFGTEVAAAYKALATTMSKNELSLSIQAPNREAPTRLSAKKAERVADALRVVTEPLTFEETIVGLLSIADATQSGFGLHLDPQEKRPEVLKGKRMIRGVYTPEAEASIIEHGLWGHRVRAHIRIERDAIVSTSTIRPPTFTLISVEAAS